MRSIYYAGFFFLLLASTACMRQGPQNVDVVDQTYIHRYGVAVPSDFWASSGEHGAVVSTMADGVVVSRNYAAGVLDGETSYSYPHSSQVQKKEFYQQGILTKEGEFFFDGTPQSETSYDLPQNIKTISTWYLGGTPKSVENYQGDRLLKGDYYSTSNQNDGRVENFQGTRLVRDDYGQLLTTETIQDGQLTTRTNYHPNGSPNEIIPFQDGKVEGTKRTFYPAGEPNTIEQWADGMQHGPTSVYQHGEKYAEVMYVNGNKNGIERRYRDGQDVVQEISWDNGKLHGPTTTYVGGTSKTDWFYQGNPISKTDYEFMMNKPVTR